MPEICSLCGQQSDLQASHIIPKFVGKWLKDTSASGFIRSVKTPEKRAQDLVTLPLLCTACEQRFSKLEAYFARYVFYPFHEKKIRSFEYDERLELFVASLNWRTLKVGYGELEKSNLTPFIDKAEQDWRDYLLGKKSHMKPYENHILFLDYVTDESKVPEQIQWYTLRAVDSTLAGNDKRIFAYTKFPWMIFVTSIYPYALEGWEETEIKQTGKISVPQNLKDGSFGEFLIDRAKLAVSPIPTSVSDDINRKMLQAIKKDPKRFLESATLDVIIAEKDRSRKEKMKNMPDFVRALVDEILVKAIDEPNGIKSDNQLTKMHTRKIADIISDLSDIEASMLDSKIQFIIRESKISVSDLQTTLETESIWITFMVNPYSTIKYQRSKIEIERLKKLQPSENKPIAVFSMNPNMDGISFETSFLI